MPTMTPKTTNTLRRELNVFGAMMMGLGSILGTGVFVSIGLAAGIAGPAVILSIALAAFVAVCNALSSAQLAASHPVSGGTYEYGYTYLHPVWGFTAGWMFICAKSASAATAALGFAGYLLHILEGETTALVPVAVVVCIGLTLIVLTGIRRSHHVNTVIVSITIAALLIFVLSGLKTMIVSEGQHFRPFFSAQERHPLPAFLNATALMFVAYTGYGRIATLGEEVRRPQLTIPRAIILTLIVAAFLYMGVAVVAIGSVGSQTLAQATQTRTAPLEMAAQTFELPAVAPIVALGAMTAMLGVLLNLILGLSRVVLAMGRRGDLPTMAARLNRTQTTPYVAVIAVGVIVTGLVLIGNVKTTWSFSAFTVLVYYAITNLAALRLRPEQRCFPRWFAYAGLLSCIFLAFWVDVRIWCIGLILLAVGLLWHGIARRWGVGQS